MVDTALIVQLIEMDLIAKGEFELSNSVKKIKLK